MTSVEKLLFRKCPWRCVTDLTQMLTKTFWLGTSYTSTMTGACHQGLYIHIFLLDFKGESCFAFQDWGLRHLQVKPVYDFRAARLHHLAKVSCENQQWQAMVWHGRKWIFFWGIEKQLTVAVSSYHGTAYKGAKASYETERTDGMEYDMIYWCKDSGFTHCSPVR